MKISWDVTINIDNVKETMSAGIHALGFSANFSCIIMRSLENKEEGINWKDELQIDIEMILAVIISY